jgi:hypothetical protein
VTGFVQLLSEPPVSVRLDGRDLPNSPRVNAGNGYWYDKDSGVLRLRYRHDRPHTIEVSY